MKVFKYLIFLSILSGLFFVIYQESDQKGLRKLWTSFKIACIIAAGVVGLIPVNTEAMEPAVNNNQVYHERLVSEQEFNSFEYNDRQVILAKTGDSVSPVPTSGQPSSFPTPPVVNRPSRPSYVPPYRVAPKVDDKGLGGAANPAGASNGVGAA